MKTFYPSNSSLLFRPLTGCWTILLLLAGLVATTPAAGQGKAITGPAGSVSFGSKVTVLPNGNFAVADPGFNGKQGAVYLYKGTNGGRISILTGSQPGDQVGSGGLVALANGNFVVSSPEFGGGGTAGRGQGAVTWVNGSTGLTGTVTTANSLVGSLPSDQVGYVGPNAAGIMALPNGNYLVRSPSWSSGSAVGAGAVTWGSGTSGVSGAVSSSNSLVGQYTYDGVGIDYKGASGVVVLANNNYVVVVPRYRVSTTTGESYGAVAWGSGTAGVKGILGAGNALVGGTSGDRVGGQGIMVLPSGNYLVISFLWSNSNAKNAGAVTWGSGTAGVKGTISANNSLVGGAQNENLGDYGVLLLANGNYVVASPYWSAPGSISSVSLGAVTWGSGTAGVKGIISASNSLVGSATGDQVGYNGSDISVFPLPNGNYVVFSPKWDNRTASAVADAGALTLGNGTGNTVGPVTACNSIVGNVANQGSTLSFSYNPGANNLLGGLPAENKLVVGVGAPAAPTGAASQPYITGATVAKLQATGAAIQWYGAAAGGSRLASSLPLTNGSTYYATQTVNGCESTSRLAVKVASAQSAQLTTLTAALAGPATVQVSWSTTSEKDSQAFEVERSPDGVAFTRIGTVAAAGSSSSARSYELPDVQLPARATTLYYRLHQLNKDGTASYSSVHSVVLPGAEAGLRLYPNPAPGGAATLVGATPGTMVTVTDALGREVLTTPADPAGTAALVLPTGLPVGVYVVRVGSAALRLTVE